MNKLKLDFDCAVNGLVALEKYKVAPSRYFLVLYVERRAQPNLVV
jgi:hypothetical protein